MHKPVHADVATQDNSRNVPMTKIVLRGTLTLSGSRVRVVARLEKGGVDGGHVGWGERRFDLDWA